MAMVRRCVLAVLVLCVPGRTAAQGDQPSEFFVHVGQDSLWVGMYEPLQREPGASALLLVPGFPANTMDVLGLGRSLSDAGVPVFVMQPRGHGKSSGWSTFANALEDVGAVLHWLQTRQAVPPEVQGTIALGGHSWGGGIALAYAAEHPEVERVVAVAASDHGVFIRRVDEDPAYGERFRRALHSLEAPAGPVRFDVEADFDELRSDWERHDLATIAPLLANRDLLLVAGWDDKQVEIEHQVLPFYRSLKEAEAESVRIVAYQDDHSFQSVRLELAAAIHSWLVQRPGR